MDGTAGGAAQAPREIELKLDCAGPDLGALAAHPLLAAEPGSLVTADLVTTYYDTPARDLRAAGLTLRVRAGDGRFVQTVKAGEGGVGLFDRAEWEAEVAGEAPEPAAWAGTAAEPVLRAAGAAPERVFATVMTRRTVPVTHGASRILVTLDEGRVESADAAAPLCELELEVQSGQAADLFALAQVLAETLPLRLGVLSKSARGFALLDGAGPRPAKAEPVALPEDASAAEVFRRVARACLRHLRLNETALLDGPRDPDALHQMRVALRRLRSALSLFAPLLEGDPRAASVGDEIKRVTEPFGQARNLDVYLAQTLPMLAEHHPDDPALDDLRRRAEALRADAYAAVLALLDSPQWRGLVLDVAGWIEAGAWAEHPAAAEDGRDFAARVLERARRRLKRRSRGLRRIDPEARHRARIAGKKLRYGAEFFAGLYPQGKARRRRKAFSDALADLQDHLGTLNDLETARSVTEAFSGPGGPALPAPGEATVADLLARAAKARADLLDVKRFWHR
jgi:triphosphatase